MLVPGNMSMTGLGDVANDTWPSTGEIDNETKSLDLTIRQLAQDSFNGELPGFGDTSLQTAWNTFIADWSQWRDAAYFWNPGRRDELLTYRKRFNDLLALMKGAGTVTTIGTTQVGSTTAAPDGLDKVSDILTKALWVAGIVGVVWAGHTVYKEFR